MLNLHRGLNHQATIIATAPLIGLLGTVDRIVACGLQGHSGSQWSIFLSLIDCLAESLYPAVYGLALAILTTWSRNYLTHQAGALLAETKVPR